jgi:hypothetical protein
MIEETTLTQVLPQAAPADWTERAGLFKTFSMWAMACHVALAAGLLVAPALAHHWLLPASHLFAWAVFVGSHVLVGLYPETMYRPRIAGHAKLHGKCLTILVGHEVLHVAPLVALYAVPGIWPAHGALTPAAWLWGTVPALLLGGLYFAGQFKADNPYRVTKAHFGIMFAAALAAGLGANVLALWRL